MSTRRASPFQAVRERVAATRGLRQLPQFERDFGVRADFLKCQPFVPLTA
jgi:hypothetical protein